MHSVGEKTLFAGNKIQNYENSVGMFPVREGTSTDLSEPLRSNTITEIIVPS